VTLTYQLPSVSATRAVVPSSCGATVKLWTKAAGAVRAVLTAARETAPRPGPTSERVAEVFLDNADVFKSRVLAVAVTTLLTASQRERNHG
jgi:hypothetical protein